MPSRDGALAPDLDLVCALARVEGGFAGAGGARRVEAAGAARPAGSAPAPGSWERAFDAAIAHNALGAILPALAAASVDFPVLDARITRAEETLGAQALVREAELHAVIRLLESAGVEAALLKGAFLAACVYGDFAARPMGDFDLLVRREDLARARAALLQAGYRSEDPMDDGDPPGKAAPDRSGGALHLRSPAGQAIELRWDLTQGRRLRGAVRFPFDEMWRRRRRFPAAAFGSVLGLAPADHLLYLAYHAGVLHLFTALVWVIDVDRFVRRFGGEIDWADLAGLARRAGCATCLWRCLHLARECLGTPVNGAALAALRPGPVRAALARAALGGARALRGLEPPSRWRTVVLQMILLDSLAADGRSLWQGMLPLVAGSQR